MSVEKSSAYESGSMCVVYVAVPSLDVANTLASNLVERRLAACVNIVPQITSIYRWQGKIENSTESMLIIKTRSNLVDDLSQFVRENHPYEIAEVISMPITNGNPPYLSWLASNLP